MNAELQSIKVKVDMIYEEVTAGGNGKKKDSNGRLETELSKVKERIDDMERRLSQLEQSASLSDRKIDCLSRSIDMHVKKISERQDLQFKLMQLYNKQFVKGKKIHKC